MATCTLSSSQSASPLLPPEYLRDAHERYHRTSTRQAQLTIALAYAGAKFMQDIATGQAGPLPSNWGPKRAAMHVLTSVLSPRLDKSIASRLFAIHELGELAVQQGLMLAAVRSQGALFALVAAVHKARRTGEPFSLAEAIDDASSMAISEFRKKYADFLRPRSFANDLAARTCRWISCSNDVAVLRQVQAALTTRLAALKS